MKRLLIAISLIVWACQAQMVITNGRYETFDLTAPIKSNIFIDGWTNSIVTTFPPMQPEPCARCAKMDQEIERVRDLNLTIRGLYEHTIARLLRYEERIKERDEIIAKLSATSAHKPEPGGLIVLLLIFGTAAGAAVIILMAIGLAKIRR